MATQLTTCYHLYHRRFSPGMTVSADELDDSSGAALCPVCGKVSTLACMSELQLQLHAF